MVRPSLVTGLGSDNKDVVKSSDRDTLYQIVYVKYTNTVFLIVDLE